jgi:hypothetical protein
MDKTTRTVLIVAGAVLGLILLLKILTPPPPPPPPPAPSNALSSLGGLFSLGAALF